MWTSCGFNERNSEWERKLIAFYSGDVGRHPMFCFAFRQRVRKRDWIGLLSAGSLVIYSMVILALPLHSLSLFFSLYLQPYPSPPFIHIDLLYLSLFLSLHLVQDTDDKVSHLTFLEFLRHWTKVPLTKKQKNK